VRTAELAFELYKRRGADRVLVGAPEELIGEFKGKLHPYLRERIAGRVQVDVENASLDDVRSVADERSRRTAPLRARGARPPRRGRRPRRRGGGGLARCSTRSTRRAWRRC
jgi:hypothetical protein